MESCVNHVIDTARPRASPSSRDQLTSVSIKVVPGSADQRDNKSCDCDKFSGRGKPFDSEKHYRHIFIQIYNYP
ncbi:hypothetical protein Bpfe_011071 [Biomphalaria pfeifferi]|uniref:Uncharacterized protein n=1 Tax=Biomphalaria pfeifferi TaxID=112525 RepID=A0AAD8BTL6_BIOPF|nr:hypothetical protein Bpfe_011071 [Biomphalaria pfeifferi]